MPNWIRNIVIAHTKTAELLAAFKGTNAHGEEEEVTFNKIVPTPPEVDQGDVQFGNEKPLNWYDWNCEHWGTKWDACHGEVYSRFVEFDTAWSTPEPVIKALAKMIDDPVICVYADEDIGSNCGAYVCFPNGDVDEISPETMFAEAVWGNGSGMDEIAANLLEYHVSDHDYEE